MTSNADERFKISWYNPEKTILLCDVRERWQWDEARTVIKSMNDHCSTVNHGVYSVFNFHEHTSLMPQGGGAIPNLRALIDTGHPNDELIIFVGISNLITTFISIAGQVYGMRNLLSKFRFVPTMEEAMAEIQKHQASKTKEKP